MIEIEYLFPRLNQHVRLILLMLIISYINHQNDNTKTKQAGVTMARFRFLKLIAENGSKNRKATKVIVVGVGS